MVHRAHASKYHVPSDQVFGIGAKPVAGTLDFFWWDLPCAGDKLDLCVIGDLDRGSKVDGVLTGRGGRL